MVLLKPLSEDLLSYLLLDELSVLLVFILWSSVGFCATFPANLLCSYWADRIVEFGGICGLRSCGAGRIL